MFTEKIIWVIDLIGFTKNGTKAKTRQAGEVVCFADSSGKCNITYDGRGSIVMELGGRRVLFTRHRKLNYYKAEHNGKELRVALKKTTGTLKCLERIRMPDHVVARLVADGNYRNRSDY